MAITQTTDVSWVQAAYDAYSRPALRSALVYDGFADTFPVAQAMPGSSVILDITNDIAAATTPLTQNVDPTPTTLGDSQVTVTLDEYGSVVGRTRKLSAFSYIPVDPRLSDVIGRNAALTLDQLALTKLAAGTNVNYASTAVSRVTVGAAMTLSSVALRTAVANLRIRNAYTWDGNAFAGIVAPDTAYDLYTETGAAAWRDPHNYTEGGNQNIWNGEVGLYAGIRFIEIPAVSTLNWFINSGVGGTVDVFRTLIFGRESLAKAYSPVETGPEPEVRVAPIVDKLWRFYHIGWVWYGGYAIFRQQCIQGVESSSTITV
jgi:N4-gp56 family major capsid protein